MRKPVIAANWKMYKTPAQAQEFLQSFLPLVADDTRDEILLFPSYVDLSVAIAATAGSNVSVGAQNIHYAEEGAYTGEISPSMVEALGATHVLVGHSERRQYFGETDQIVNKKIHAAIHHGLTPVICMGETLEEREAGRTEEALLLHCQESLKGIIPQVAENFIIAYEPIWAIGTGKTATPEMAGMAHFFIRTQIAHLLGRHTADRIRILYGGSVKPENACALLNQPEVDGALVGGASLDPYSFAKIVNY
ncbi:triose-phosphate isomerase [Silvibacterium dinghuense]|uniref:Triosephosphate isomerase n=1 Tax=Silvibacterium dinghuense TaxID=1560006 RepID=A0A4Q1SCY5_9BACT|nr:triose-phosphate isomerase [Silvibacterium dinghuense]RXS95076.1 triose-phosphate isomerase [Silvibacterium dinghuense]GGH10379.1 triosephosphate isomerase [Silvibacterium dinghuense]